MQTGTLVCNGAVHLILADGAKLTATGNDDNKTPGIQVSGDGNSLAIYGQSAQSGELIANGGNSGAGIGGERFNSGSNITINGGVVKATGGRFAAGIGGGMNGSGYNITIHGGTVTANGGQFAAGIGGRKDNSGSNITINGGTVTANGGEDASAIGGGYDGSGWNIKAATALTVYADNTNPPILEIPHTDDDIASHTAFRYVVVKDVVTGIKDSAIAAIASAKAIYNSGLGEMGEPCEDCPSVEVTKGTKTVKLYNPENVRFKKE